MASGNYSANGCSHKQRQMNVVNDIELSAAFGSDKSKKLSIGSSAHALMLVQENPLLFPPFRTVEHPIETIKL